MNNQIDHRLALRALFESSLQQKLNTLNEEQLVEFLSSLRRLFHQGAAKYYGSRGNQKKQTRHLNKAEFSGLKGGIKGVKFNKDKDAIERNNEKFAPKPEPKAATGQGGASATRPVALKRREFLAHAERMRQAQLNKEREETIGSQTSDSTDYSRLGLRSLFEAVILEAGNRKGSLVGQSSQAGETGSRYTDGIRSATKTGKPVRIQNPNDPAETKAALKSSDTPPPPANLPPPTNEPFKPMSQRSAETSGGKATDPAALARAYGKEGMKPDGSALSDANKQAAAKEIKAKKVAKVRGSAKKRTARAAELARTRPERAKEVAAKIAALRGKKS